MRSRLLPLLAIGLTARHTSSCGVTERPLPRQEDLLAAGGSAIPFIRPLPASPDSEVRRKETRLLLDSGEDIHMTREDRVRLLLGKVAGDQTWPGAAVRAIESLRERGEEVEPVLMAAAEGSGPEAEAA